MKTVRVNTNEIQDWVSFHRVFSEAFGFPDFYGANMNAWIDCMSSLDDPADGMSTITVEPGQMVLLKLPETEDFKSRCPEQFDALVECTAFVNQRYGKPVISLVLL